MAENAAARNPKAAAVSPRAGAPQRAFFAGFLAWLVPGAGHFYLGRRARSVVFAAIIGVSSAVGCALDGRIYWPLPGQPLSLLGTLAEAGLGGLYVLLRFALGLTGDPAAAGFEYGTAFLVTAGLMNYLLVLDAWDIAVGSKD